MLPVVPLQDFSVLRPAAVEEKQPEPALSLQLAAIINGSPAASDTLAALLHALRGFMNCRVVELWIPDIDYNDLSLGSYSFAKDDAAAAAFVERTLEKKYAIQHIQQSPAWRTKLPFWYGSLEHSQELMRKADALEAGFRSAMAYPIIRGDAVTAVIYFFSHGLMKQDDVLMRDLGQAARLLALEIDRHNIQEVFSLYFNSTAEYMAIMSAKGRLRQVNGALEKVLGEEAVTGKTLLHWIHPEDITVQSAHMERVLEQKENCRCETRLLNKKGQLIWVSWAITYVAAQDYFLLAGRDVTGRHKMLEELQEKQAELERTATDIRNVLANINEVFYKFDINGLFIHAEESIYALTGYRPDELMGRLVFEFLHPDDVAPVLDTAMEGIRNKTTVKNQVYRFKHKNGSWRLFQNSGQAVYDAAGHVLYIIALVHDVTERFEKERLLKEQEDRYRKLFHSHPIPLFVVDAETYTITTVNQAALQQYGYTIDEFTGLHIAALRPEEEVPQLLERLDEDRQHLQPGNFMKAAWQHKKKNGDIFEAEVHYHVIDFLGARSVLAAIMDVTEKKRAGERIHYLASLVENVSDTIYTCDKNFRIITWNKAASVVYGISEAEAIGKTMTDLIPVIYAGGYSREAITRQIMQQGEWKGEAHFIRPLDQKEITLLISGTRLTDEAGQLLAFIVTGKDITERKLAEKIIVESEQRFRHMADSAPVMIWVTNEKDETFYYSKCWLDFTGKTLEEELTEKWEEKLHPHDRERITTAYREAVQKKESFTVEYRLRSHNGNWNWVIDRGSPRFLPDGSFVGYTGVCFNIQDRKEVEARLLQAEIKKQKLVAKAGIDGQEKEREEMSRELHDNVNQLISTAKLYMEVARRNTEDRNEMIDRSVETLNMAVQEIRRLSKSLNPPSLGNLGLNDAIAELVDDIHIAGKLQITFNPSGTGASRIKPEVALTLYRIVQEQVNNIIRHSGASKAAIETTVEDNVIILIVSDTGVGFDVGAKRKGVGLTNIINRAGLFNGTVYIDSTPGKGSTLRVLIPLT